MFVGFDFERNGLLNHVNADLVCSSGIELTSTANIFIARIYIANEILSTSNKVMLVVLFSYGLRYKRTRLDPYYIST